MLSLLLVDSNTLGHVIWNSCCQQLGPCGWWLLLALASGRFRNVCRTQIDAIRVPHSGMLVSRRGVAIVLSPSSVKSLAKFTLFPELSRRLERNGRAKLAGPKGARPFGRNPWVFGQFELRAMLFVTSRPPRSRSREGGRGKGKPFPEGTRRKLYKPLSLGAGGI